MEEGLYLQGLEDYTNETIRVVAQNTTKEQVRSDISWERFFILWEKVPPVRTGSILYWQADKELNLKKLVSVYDQTDPRGRAGWSSVLFYR